MNVEALRPQRHAPPPGWLADVFDRVTDALALALVDAYKRDEHEEEETA